MKIGDRFLIKITDIDYEGQGIGRKDNMVIFVENAMPDEEVECEIVFAKTKVAFAKTIKIIKRSPDRISDVAVYGGCDMLHTSYPFEVIFKKKKISDTIRKNADIVFEVNDVILSDNIYNYRNKVQIPFQKQNNEIVFGYYIPKTHDIISMDKALVEPKITFSIMNDIKDFFLTKNLSIYDEITHKGILRNVMLRKNYLEELMIVIVAKDFFKEINELSSVLTSKYKDIKSIYINVNNDKTNVLMSNDFRLVYGKETLIEKIIDVSLYVSPGSFLQINHDMTERLYNEAFRMAGLNKSMNVIDAYSGIGSIALNMAKHVNKVYGIEVVESAVMDARENMKLNSITNCEFILGKCEDEIEKLTKREKIDLIVFDPPRKGCEEKFLATVVNMKIEKIVYISCNIATAARDIKYLIEKGYELKEVTPVDMFSRTSHIESVCFLSL